MVEDQEMFDVPAELRFFLLSLAFSSLEFCQLPNFVYFWGISVLKKLSRTNGKTLEANSRQKKKVSGWGYIKTILARKILNDDVFARTFNKK